MIDKKTKNKKYVNELFKKNKWIFFLVILFLLIVYNNLNLMPKREMIHFYSVTVSGTEIIYNKTIQKIATPLFYQGNTNSAVLLLHGFGGTPYELKEMAEYLAKNNITVYVPLLAGHGTNLNDLKKITWHDDYAEVEQAVKILNLNYSQVYVGGLCNGGLLALEFASKNEVAGVISLSAPIFFSSKLVDMLSNNFVFSIIRIFTPYLRRIEYGVTRDPIAAKSLPSYDRFPVNSLITANELTKKIRVDIRNISSPVLIIQSTFDNRAAPYSARFIYDNVLSNQKKLVWLNNSGHVITIDYDKQLVFEESLNFVKDS
jgi:carboxylesterase